MQAGSFFQLCALESGVGFKFWVELCVVAPERMRRQTVAFSYAFDN